MEQRVRDFLRPGKEAAERVAGLVVAPLQPGASWSFYEALCMRDLRVDWAESGLVRYSYVVAPGCTDADGNFSPGAIANLVDELGGQAIATISPHARVSVNISIAYLSTARLGDELEITSRVLGHKGNCCDTVVTLKNKRTGELVAEGRHSLYGKLRSNL